MNVFQSLTKVLSDNNKHLHSSDVTEPAKFDGQDSQWDDWYLQLRTYFEAKGWLSTFEHPTGPGTVGFDLEVNKKIYHKLLALCRKGTAATYVTKAANFNGWEAARCLLDRYKGFSKQRQRSLCQLIEQLRHTHGTNMSRHIDRFERICGQMAHNNPDKPPTEEMKIDWFMDSVTEKTYDSVHTACTDKLLDGGLTFAKVTKLYTHRCFQRYPHFQLDDDLEHPTKTISNNSNSYHDGRRDNGKGKGSGRGRLPQPNSGGRGRTRTPYNRSLSRSPHKGKGKGKSKSNTPRDKGKSPYRTPTGDRTQTGTPHKAKETCSYCGGNHNDDESLLMFDFCSLTCPRSLDSGILFSFSYSHVPGPESYGIAPVTAHAGPVTVLLSRYQL
jgi:hypothetical protein